MLSTRILLIIVHYKQLKNWAETLKIFSFLSLLSTKMYPGCTIYVNVFNVFKPQISHIKKADKGLWTNLIWAFMQQWWIDI